MAHKKAGGAVKNIGDSRPKYLGVKLSDGQLAKAGAIIVRQRGSWFFPGQNVGLGRDQTLFAKRAGTVKFASKRKLDFRGQPKKIKTVSVKPARSLS